MPAKLIRVVDGPFERDGVVVVPRGQWGVLEMSRVPDPDDTTTPFDPGEVRAVCRTEQEAERVAREMIFGSADGPAAPDALDALPSGDPDEPWDLEPLPDHLTGELADDAADDAPEDE